MSAPVSLPCRFLGCDVGKTHIVVFDDVAGITRTIANHADALTALAAELDDTCLVVCEATGGYETALLEALTRAGRPAHRADARKVKAFIRSFGTLGKTDAIDAHRLAQYGRERHASLARWQPPEAAQRELQALVLIRRDLVAARVSWSNRHSAPGAELVASTISAMLQAIAAQLSLLDDRIEAVMKSSRALSRDAAILRGIAGIGPKTAAALLALMPELGSLGRRQAAALAGLAPHPRQSGATDAYRRTRGGRPEVKRALFMAAMAARKSNSPLRDFFNRLIAAGKKPLLVLTAIMRKIVVIANARLRDARAPQLS